MIRPGIGQFPPVRSAALFALRKYATLNVKEDSPQRQFLGVWVAARRRSRDRGSNRLEQLGNAWGNLEKFSIIKFQDSLITETNDNSNHISVLYMGMKTVGTMRRIKVHCAFLGTKKFEKRSPQHGYYSITEGGGVGLLSIALQYGD
jgi:hypothetical protein